MSGDLTTSAVARQNILNNPFALAEIEKAAGVKGIPFDGRRVVLKETVASFFEVSIRTIDGYLDKHKDELIKNGYETLKGKRLKLFKKSVASLDAHEINFMSIGKVSQLGIFDFRAFLNLAMLLSESDRARVLRQAILDIAIDTVNARTGGVTKYINQRDEEYLPAAYAGESYRRKFTDALKQYVELGPFSYATYTDKVYKSIFLEQSKQYKKILQLDKSDNTRSTFYAEIIDLVASFENGFAEAIKMASEKEGRKLITKEADDIFKAFAEQPLFDPLIRRAREKMASRDLALRGAYHKNLEHYISSLPREDFERFLGDQTKELSKRLEDAKDVLKRLKDR